MTTPTPAETADSTRTSGSTGGRARTAAAWLLQLLGAALFLYFGSGKVTGSNAAAVETFDQIGLGDWFRVAIGSLEILGAIGLLIPFFAGLAAACLALLAVGAVAITLLLGQSGVVAPLLCFVVVVVVVALRRRTVLSPVSFARRHLARRTTSSSARAAATGHRPTAATDET